MASKTQNLTRVMAYLLGLLNIAAGIPKILRMPQELELFDAIGLLGIAVSILGLVQLGGGILLFWPRYRLAGALLAVLALLVSSVAIFIGGDPMFGLISLLPIVVAVIVIYVELYRTRSDAG